MVRTRKHATPTPPVINSFLATHGGSRKPCPGSQASFLAIDRCVFIADLMRPAMSPG